MSKKFFDIVPPKDKKSFREEPEVLPEELPLEKETIEESNFPPVLEEKTEEEERPPETEKKKKPKPRRFFLRSLLLSLSVLAALGAAGYAIFSKTEIEIWPQTEMMNFKESVAIDSALEQTDFSKKVIPAKVFSDQKIGSQDFVPSGKIVKEEKARGIIKVYNAYSDTTQTLRATTRFVSSEGKLFKSLKAETIPGRTYDKGKVVPGEKDIEVQAAEAGENYNIGASTFSLPAYAGTPQYTAFYGKSSSPMAGGFKGEASQVTQQDIDTGKRILGEKLEQESREFLKKITPTDFIFLDGLISQEIVQEKTSAEAGKEADSFTLQTEVKSEVLAFRKSDVENFAKNTIVSKLPSDKKLQEESLKIDYSIDQKEVSKAVVNLEIWVKVYNDVRPEELKKAFSDKSFQEINLLLKDMPQIKKIEIKSSPFWQKRVPDNLQRIETRLNLGD